MNQESTRTVTATICYTDGGKEEVVFPSKDDLWWFAYNDGDQIVSIIIKEVVDDSDSG